MQLPIMNTEELKSFLDEKSRQYNHPRFVESDPIQVPHQFSKKEDIEVIGFLTATIAWGNRKSIITNANKLVKIMGNNPYDFVMTHRGADLEALAGFVHRTFNSEDLAYFIKSLQRIYQRHGGLEAVFARYATESSLQPSISAFKKVFFELPHSKRTTKHVSDPEKGSAAKRINMFLRWMVRNDNAGVDFGIWPSITPAQLSCPLDVHTGNVARRLGLLTRRQNDAKALRELDRNLRRFDATDPVRYDYALFGLGAFEGW